MTEINLIFKVGHSKTNEEINLNKKIKEIIKINLGKNFNLDIKCKENKYKYN